MLHVGFSALEEALRPLALLFATFFAASRTLMPSLTNLTILFKVDLSVRSPTSCAAMTNLLPSILAAFIMASRGSRPLLSCRLEQASGLYAPTTVPDDRLCHPP